MRKKKLNDLQRKTASKLFHQLALLTAAGTGYQFVQKDLLGITLTFFLTIIFGFYSIDFLKEVKDNKNKGEIDDE